MEVRRLVSAFGEEFLPHGESFSGSGDLEFGLDEGYEQAVGIRFNPLGVPRSGVVAHSFIQFVSAGSYDGNMAIEICGEMSSVGGYEPSFGGVTGGRLTERCVLWRPHEWRLEGDSGMKQQTVDISGIITELMNQDDWVSEIEKCWIEWIGRVWWEGG